MIRYPDLLRLRFGHIEIRSDKRYVPATVETGVFSSKDLIVEEKIDGSQCAVGWKGGAPYAQGRNSHIDAYDKRVAYDGMWYGWVLPHWGELERTRGHLIFGEWMKPTHSVPYDRLPDFFMAYDVWCRRTKRFVGYDEKIRLLNEWGIKYVRLLYRGKLIKDDVPALVDGVKSEYSSLSNCEGCVLKDYRSQVFVKYVSREFLEEMFDDSGHWTGRRTVMYNRLSGW